MDELKPCPFCGVPVFIDRLSAKIDDLHLPDGTGGFYSVDALSYTWFVKCNKCGIRSVSFKDKIVREKSGEIKIYADGRKDAIDAWNRRAAE